MLNELTPNIAIAIVLGFAGGTAFGFYLSKQIEELIKKFQDKK